MSFHKRKAFGQHFLVDLKCITTIVSAGLSDLTDEAVLEIGPGDGALTNLLLERLPPKRLNISEIDYALIEKWKQDDRVYKVHEGDFVRNAEAILATEKKWIVVSNLPYASGTAILGQLIAYPEKIKKMVLMFQKEVALRLTAAPSTPDRGSLSVVIQNEWDVKPVLIVKPLSFKPPPKVDSMVVELLPRVLPQIKLESSEDRLRFDQMLRLAFSQRRKMLRNNLGQEDRWNAALVKSGVANTLRAEALGFDDWRKIWDAYS